MTPRDNLIDLYHRRGYDCAPVQFSMCPALWEQYRALAGDMPLPEYFDYAEGFAIEHVPGVRFKAREPVDWSLYYDEPLKQGVSFDSYGVAREPGGKESMHMTRMRHPLARATSLEELQAYPFPELDDQDTAHISEAVERALERGLASSGCMHCTVWETAWYIRDMTQLMMDMMMDDEKAVFLLDTITDHACRRAAAFARSGVDIIELGDDLGMQQTIMMSRQMYREWIMPRLARVISAAKAVNPDVLIFYHTCGYVTPLIGDLIDAGVEILNPVQPECMDFAEIHAQYGDRLSFSGTLGTQTTMPFGTPEEVRRVVIRNLDIAGPRGGLLCSPTHLLEPEVPWENIEAYVAACKEYRSAGG